MTPQTSYTAAWMHPSSSLGGFTNDVSTIKSKVSEHFQNVGYSSHPDNFTSFDNLPDYWKEIYTPKQLDNPHSNDIFNNNITYEELRQTINQLLNKKAAGPSGISYEIIRHLPDNVISSLLILKLRV